MSELRRWSEEGATPSELSLLEASRREVAPKAARARALGMLGAGTTVLASSTVATSSSAAAAVAKVVAVALLVAGTAGSALVWHASQAGAPAAPSQRKAMAAHPRATPVRAVSPQDSSPLEPAVASVVEPSQPILVGPWLDPREALTRRETVPSRPAPSVPAPSTGTLTLEVAALERAHDALAGGDRDGALRTLDRYRSRFPHGELSSEEAVLRVEVLLALGDSDRAATLANAYAAAHPGDPYTRRVRELVLDARKE